MIKSQLSPAEISRKEARLTEVASVLKLEFAGLDEQIDQVMGSVKFWYLLPEAMQRPTVVCLWGMTGVGKTALLLRLVQLLGLEERMLFEDMGKQTTNNPSENFFQVNAHLANAPSVIILDEIHTARTCDATGNEIDRPWMRDFWGLLDSGIVQRDPRPLIDLRTSFRDRLARTLEYQKKDSTGQVYGPEISMYEVDYFMRLVRHDADVDTEFARSMEDQMQWLRNAIAKLEETLRQRSALDYRRSLIFLTGNLDELFSFTSISDPDSYSADELHAASRKVTLPQIKQVLQTRFRPEQVARMGNGHIFFPALSEKSFRKVIQKKFKSINAFTKEHFGLSLLFSECIEDYIFTKGVVPSQGCRPLLSSISSIMEARLPEIIIKAHGLCSEVEVKFRTKNCELVVTGAGAELTWNLEDPEDKKKIERKLSEQINHLVAVHEAGHAVVGTISLGMLPKRILLGTSIPGVHGLVQFPEYEIGNYVLALGHLKMCLGGRVAEEQVFGAEYLSAGSERDLKVSTRMANHLIAEFGMGRHLGVSAFMSDFPEALTSYKDRDDDEVEGLLYRAKQGALEILEIQRPLFMALSQELITAGNCSRVKMEELLRTHFIGDKHELEALLKREAPAHQDEYCSRWDKYKKALKAA